MQILFSQCNNRIAGLPALGLVDVATGQVEIVQLPEEVAHSTGATGLALSDEFVFVIVSISAGQLAIFQRSNLALCNLIPLPGMADVHSIWHDGGSYLYVVSTGTDEVFRLRLAGATVTETTLCWRPVADGPREDRHHLNSVFGANGDVYVSGFGAKIGENWRSTVDGFVINIMTGEKVATGLQHPHTVMLLGNSLAYCDSRTSSLKFVDSSRRQQLPGYTRGICAADDAIFVGTSLGRRVSKSTGVINNPNDPGIAVGTHAIYRLNGESLAIDQMFDLSCYGSECYDLLAIPEAHSWPTIRGEDWQQQQLRKMLGDADEQQRQLQSVHSQLDTVQTQLHTVQQAAADQRAILENELQVTRQAVVDLQQQVAAQQMLSARNAALAQHLAQAEQQLGLMEATRLWRWGTRFWQVRDRLLRRKKG